MVAHSKSLPPPPPSRRVRGKMADPMKSKPVPRAVHPNNAILSDSESEVMDAYLDCE